MTVLFLFFFKKKSLLGSLKGVKAIKKSAFTSEFDVISGGDKVRVFEGNYK